MVSRVCDDAAQCLGLHLLPELLRLDHGVPIRIAGGLDGAAQRVAALLHVGLQRGWVGPLAGVVSLRHCAGVHPHIGEAQNILGEEQFHIANVPHKEADPIRRWRKLLRLVGLDKRVEQVREARAAFGEEGEEEGGAGGMGRVVKTIPTSPRTTTTFF